MGISGVSSPSGLAALLAAAAKNKQNSLTDPVTGNSSGALDAAGSANGPTYLTQPPAQDSNSDIVKNFESFLKESPAQQMQDEWLQAHGITKEQFDQMSAADKQKVITEMKQDIETQLKKKMQAATAAATNIVV